jgi:hypothetical protein
MISYFPAGQLYLLSSAPMASAAQLCGKTWSTNVPYSETHTEIDCDSPQAESVSECTIRIVPSENTAQVAKEAKAVLLHLKAKAAIPAGPNSNEMNYCQIDAKLQSVSGNWDTQNHAIHTEEWGGGPDYQESRRRIAYTTAVVPLASDGSFVISIRKGIWGRSEVEIAIMLEGYYR